MSEHEVKLKQERRLLVQRTSDLHQARIGGKQVAHDDTNDGEPYLQDVQTTGEFFPESEARRLAANGSVMILKDLHGAETFEQ